METRKTASRIIYYHANARKEECDAIKRIGITVGSKILDAGCGDGTFFASCFTKPAIGIDINYKEIERAKRNFLKTYVGDIKDLQFPNKYFDLTICNSVLEHIEGVNDAVKELCRVSKQIVITVPVEIEEPRVVNRLSRILFNHRNLFCEEQWTEMFSSCGMKEKKIVRYNDRRLSTLYVLSCVFVPAMILSRLAVYVIKRSQFAGNSSVALYFT